MSLSNSGPVNDIKSFDQQWDVTAPSAVTSMELDPDAEALNNPPPAPETYREIELFLRPDTEPVKTSQSVNSVPEETQPEVQQEAQQLQEAQPQEERQTPHESSTEQFITEQVISHST